MLTSLGFLISKCARTVNLTYCAEYVLKKGKELVFMERKVYAIN